MLIIGGDLRGAYVARLAAREGESVVAVGFDAMEELEGVTRLSAEDAKPDACVLLSYPASEKEGLVPAPFAGRPLPIARIMHLLTPESRIFAGRVGPLLMAIAHEKGLTYLDPARSEAFAVWNAIPSAEGAVYAAMEKAQVCLQGMDCVIIGYGRIGQMLAARLLGFAAKVTVAARRMDARVWARSAGCAACAMEELPQALSTARLVYNTAPGPVLGFREMERMRKDALIIDLASPPYGVDLESAAVLGLTAWREPGLPGRYAPESAADYLWQTIKAWGG